MEMHSVFLATDYTGVLELLVWLAINSLYTLLLAIAMLLAIVPVWHPPARKLSRFLHLGSPVPILSSIPLLLTLKSDTMWYLIISLVMVLVNQIIRVWVK